MFNFFLVDIEEAIAEANKIKVLFSIDLPTKVAATLKAFSTELPSDLVAQLVGAWQAICQIAGSSPSLSHCLFFHLFIFLLMLIPEPHSPHACHSLRE